MLPAYLERLTPVELKNRALKLYRLLKECKLCPNECLAKRSAGEKGECNSTDKVIITNVSPHFGEEPVLVGTNGSGTIFFTNCNLKCEFCQNFDISQMHIGQTVSIEALAKLMLRLQNSGCHNINLVTPTHFTPQIVEALIFASEMGLQIPLVYNCGGYESMATLKLLENIIDIYMPDIKYSDNETAEKYSGIKNYWDVVRPAIKEMHRQVGNLKISRRKIAQRGLLIRHLVLPNNIAGSKKVIEFVANEISKESYINIMDQYRPAYNAFRHTELNRPITNKELSSILQYAMRKGIKEISS